MSTKTGWTPQSWETAMGGLLDAFDNVIEAAEGTQAQKKRRKKKHAYKPIGGRKGAPCLYCGLGAGAAPHSDPDNDGDNDAPGEPDNDALRAAKAPSASHRTCKNCGAHMATDASSCQSCGTKWASDALDDASKAPSGANAPYKLKDLGDGKFGVVNNTGELKAKFDSRAKALGYLRALYANVPGAAKRADKVKFSGKSKQRIPKKG